MPARPTSAGLKILIGGAQREAPSTAAPQRKESQAKETIGTDLRTRVFAALSLAGADLALIAWAAHHVFTRGQTMGFWDVAASAGSMLLAALCGVGAARLVLGK